MDKLAELLGYGPSFIYAAAAYGLFYWLDENLSDAAKASLASTMKLKGTDSKRVAGALVEVFDRLYTDPLLGWRAFTRSLIFTCAVSAGYLYERGDLPFSIVREMFRDVYAFLVVRSLLTALVFNILSDYVALFFIRHWLKSAGTKPIFGLITGAAIGVFIVTSAALLRAGVFVLFSYHQAHTVSADIFRAAAVKAAVMATLDYSIPATIVFAWLPLFALGILVVRAMAPLSWIVGRATWALREGEEHPLKAVGLVAGAIVFLIAIGWRVLFSR